MNIDPFEIYKKIRKTWKKNPKTKVQKDKRKKSRQQKKIDLRKKGEDY